MLSTNPRPWFCFGSTDKTTNNKTKIKRIKHKQKAKLAAGIEGQVATMLESHARQIGTIDTTTMKRARKKNENEQELRGDKT